MTPDNAPAGDSGFLSIEQAVSELTEKDEAQAAPQPAAAEPETPQPEAEPGSETDTEAETTTAEDGSEADEPGDAEEVEQPDEAEAIRLDAPKWWNKEQKAVWETLSPEVKAAVYAQEENRERVLQKDRQKLSEGEKAANETKAALAKRIQVLDAVLPSAINAHQGRWAKVDWVEASKTMDPADYQQARAEYEQDTKAIVELNEQREIAEKERFNSFVREESEKLKTECPDLIDPVHGEKRRENLSKFLLELNTPPERIARLSASEASLVYDAMRWRDAQRKALTAKKPAPPAIPVAKPTGAAPARNPTNSRLAQLRRIANPSVDEMVEIMELGGS